MALLGRGTSGAFRGTRPDGVATNYSYDNLSRLLSVLHQFAPADAKTGGRRGAPLHVGQGTLTGCRASTIDGAVYTLDSDGNSGFGSAADSTGVQTPDRTAKTDDLAGVTSNYTYDRIYELTQSLW